jgi:ATP synthase in type III secretion protein N
MTVHDKLQRLSAAVSKIKTRVPSGRVLAVSGTIVKAELAGARVGELCELRSPELEEIRFAEVVALDGLTAFLAPFGPVEGLSLRTEVLGLGRSPSILVGDYLLGGVVDAFGHPLELAEDSNGRTLEPDAGAILRPIFADPPEALSRRAIELPFVVGLRSIDSLITCAEGQRLGIFGNAGAGKSTLISQIVESSEADIYVIALVGERGREVGDFLRHAVKHKRDRTILVVATSDRPAVERMHSSFVAQAIAEHYRDQGKRVLLVVDSVTRLARAIRDIGLAAGEPPTRRGFPPSVFSILPKLFERAGNSERGSITAFYTVLVEGEDSADPIAEETRSLLDGHIVLSEKLAAQGHYPAIDILVSKSRVMGQVTDKEHRQHAMRLRELVAKYREIELLVQVGEYQAGNDPIADEAIRKIDEINKFLRQPTDESSPYRTTLNKLKELVA